LKTMHKKAALAGGLSNRLFQVKKTGAIVIGKILIAATRLLGRGGTTLPGRMAIKVQPDLAEMLAGQLLKGALVVTGTNGKTTTSALIKNILKAAGHSCIHNQSGSNMPWGVASALIDSASLGGAVTADWALMEADEGAFLKIVQDICPLGVVVTNIFRDQLDRYGEIDRIQEAIGRGLQAQPAGGFQVINADDPSLVSLGGLEGKQRLTYGLEIMLIEDSFLNTGRDLKTCPLCKKELTYERVYFAHLGHYHCPACDFRRPRPDVQLTGLSINPDGSSLLTINTSDRQININSPLPGVYNYYNLLAALTCALALKIPEATVIKTLETANPSFGRMESFKVDGRDLIIALIKNPVGANEVLRTILSRAETATLLVAINDKIADGTDVSWLWDVDFEQLAAEPKKLTATFATGLRAWDMAVRYKYAGLEQQQVLVVENCGTALRGALQATPPGGKLYILPTYTAMLEIRRHLNRMGYGHPYWEEH
jgi:lipid II isoglutaminyl synthase (glutamine-hydrolysing)